MGLLKNIGNWLWNGAKSVAGSFGIDTSGFENDEAHRWQANQADIGRQWQEQMLQKQFDYSTDMWNKTNKYNRAAAQANRFREAGLNPYMMMNGSAQSGIAQSGGTPTGMSAPSAGSGHSGTSSTPAGQFLANISAAKQSAANARLTNAEALFKETNAALLRQELEENVRRTRGGNNLMDKYGDPMLDATYKGQLRQNSFYEVQTRLTSMEAAYQELVNLNYPEHIKAQIAELASRVALNKATENLTFEQAQTEYYRGLSEIEKKDNIHLDNQIKRGTLDAAIAKVYNDSYWSYFAPDRFRLGQAFGKSMLDRGKRTDWRRIHQRGYPKPWD